MRHNSYLSLSALGFVFLLVTRAIEKNRPKCPSFTPLPPARTVRTGVWNSRRVAENVIPEAGEGSGDRVKYAEARREELGEQVPSVPSVPLVP
jgi:hypothetical protein